MATSSSYSNSGGVQRVTVRRGEPAPAAPAARPTAARPAAPARTAPRSPAARRPVSPTPEMIHQLAAKHAADAKALAYKAAYTKGYALCAEACRAALALRWGAPLGAEQSKSATGLPMTVHFKGGNRAVVQANMTIALIPAAK